MVIMHVVILYWSQDDGLALLRACMSNDWSSAEGQIQSGSHLGARDEVHLQCVMFQHVVRYVLTLYP